jgi:hypothetical protein
VYIYRDVIFDETVFLFSTLHPNAGAQLKVEISLLLPMLCTPHGDSFVAEPTVTNAANELNEVFAYSGIISAANDGNSATNSPRGVEAHQLVVENLGARSSGDSVPGVATSDPEPISVGTESVPQQSGEAACLVLHPPNPTSCRGPEEHARSSVAMCGNSESVVPAGIDSAPLQSLQPEASHRRTWLQNNIKELNIYIEVTIRYAYLTEVGEPEHVHEALQDPKWCAAMDEEYQALLKNMT